MTIDIDKLRAELRAGLEANRPTGRFPWAIEIHRDNLRALLNHIDNVEAVLREAGEVMRRALPYVDDLATMERIDAFLAKLEPSPEPVREDTYPDRVSMEPWPYIGHAPGREKSDG